MDSINTDKLSPQERSELEVQADTHGYVKQLVAKVHEWCALQEPNTENYTMGLIMKASVTYHSSSYEVDMAKRLQMIQDGLDILEPFAETDIGFFPHTFLLVHLRWLRAEENLPLMDEKLKRSYDMLMGFVNSKKLIWDFTCIYKGTSPTVESSKKAISLLTGQLAVRFLMAYDYETPNETNPTLVKFVMPAIRILLGSMLPRNQFSRLDFINNFLRILILENRFKQLNYCLACLMFLVSDYLPSEPRYNRKEANKLKAELSKLYIVWGCTIAEKSMERISGRDTIEINNESFEELEWFDGPPIEAYANQFPINLVDTPKALKKIIKNCLSWYHKMVTFLVNARKGPDEVITNALISKIYAFNVLFPDRRLDEM